MVNADLLAELKQRLTQRPRAGLRGDRFVRNCLIAAGNSGNQAFEPQLAGDPDPAVAEAAEWALGELTAGL